MPLAMMDSEYCPTGSPTGRVISVLTFRLSVLTLVLLYL